MMCRLLQALALALLAWPLAACPSGPNPFAKAGSTGSTSDLQFCVDENNRLRAKDGHGPMARSTALEEYAAVGAEEDYNSKRAHGHFSDTIKDSPARAENTCPGWLGWTVGTGPNAIQDAVKECLKAFYDEGPGGGHYDNMMGNYKKLGCGIYVEGNDITITQDFGD